MNAYASCLLCNSKGRPLLSEASQNIKECHFCKIYTQTKPQKHGKDNSRKSAPRSEDISSVQVYLAVYSTAIAHLNVWTPCKGDGVHYIVTTAGLISVFALCVILQAGIIFYGLQGIHEARVSLLESFNASLALCDCKMYAVACFLLLCDTLISS